MLERNCASDARGRLSFRIKPKLTSSAADAWAKEFFPGPMRQLKGWKARVFLSPSHSPQRQF
jgi:hypothetical protein